MRGRCPDTSTAKTAGALVRMTAGRTSATALAMAWRATGVANRPSKKWLIAKFGTHLNGTKEIRNSDHASLGLGLRANVQQSIKPCSWGFRMAAISIAIGPEKDSAKRKKGSLSGSADFTNNCRASYPSGSSA